MGHKHFATWRRALAVGLVASLFGVACSSASSTSRSAGDQPESRRNGSEPLNSSASSSSSSSEQSSTSQDGSTATEAPATTAVDSRRNGGGGDCGPASAAPSGPSVQMISTEVNGVSVELGRYPRPDYEGNPWTHWGQGQVTDDGRFVSGIGDHLGADGNSFVYVYDPTTSTLSQVGDVLASLPGRSGNWGQGKIHAQMVQLTCDEVLLATYWGRRTDPGAGDSYEGGHVMSLSLDDYTLESVGIPVPGFGIPSMASHGGLLYGEAVDPSVPSSEDHGVFFVFDPATGETVYLGDNPEHDGYRSILVADDGTAYVAGFQSELLTYAPGGQLADSNESVPDGFLRAVTEPTADGTVYGVSAKPDYFFQRTSDGQFTELAPGPGYTTSIDLTGADKVLFVPGAHGDAWEHGASVYSFDPATGAYEAIVALNEVAERELGLTLGGSYSVRVSADGARAFVMFNAGVSQNDPWGEVVLAVIDL